MAETVLNVRVDADKAISDIEKLQAQLNKLTSASDKSASAVDKNTDAMKKMSEHSRASKIDQLTLQLDKLNAAAMKTKRELAQLTLPSSFSNIGAAEQARRLDILREKLDSINTRATVVQRNLNRVMTSDTLPVPTRTSTKGPSVLQSEIVPESARTGIMATTKAVTGMTWSFIKAEATIAAFKQTFEIVANVMNSVIMFEKMESALTAIVGTTAGAKQEIEYLIETSKKFGVDIEEVSIGYTKLMAAGKGTAFTTQMIRDIFESTAIAARVLNLSGQEVKGMMYALQQMISKGTVSMEELKRQLGDRLPGAMSLAAASMKMTASEFDKLVASGKLMAIDFLPKFVKFIRTEFEPGIAVATTKVNYWITAMKNASFLTSNVFSVQMSPEYIESMQLITIGLERVQDNAKSAGQAMAGLWDSFNKNILAPVTVGDPFEYLGTYVDELKSAYLDLVNQSWDTFGVNSFLKENGDDLAKYFDKAVSLVKGLGTDLMLVPAEAMRAIQAVLSQLEMMLGNTADSIKMTFLALFRNILEMLDTVGRKAKAAFATEIEIGWEGLKVTTPEEKAPSLKRSSQTDRDIGGLAGTAAEIDAMIDESNRAIERRTQNAADTIESINRASADAKLNMLSASQDVTDKTSTTLKALEDDRVRTKKLLDEFKMEGQNRPQGIKPKEDKGAGKVESARITLQGINAEIEKMLGNEEAFGLKLEKKLAEIARTGKNAKISVTELNDVLSRYKAAATQEQERKAERAFEDLALSVARMRGETEKVREIELGRELEDWRKKLSALTGDAERVDAALKELAEAKKMDIQIKDLQTVVGFYKEMQAVSGEFGANEERINQLIDMRAELLRKNGGIQEDDLQKWVEYQKMLESRDMFAGMSLSSKRFFQDAMNDAELFGNVLDNVWKSSEDLFVKMIMREKVSFTDFANSVIADLARIMVKKAMAGLGGVLMQGLGAALGGWFGLGGTSSSSGIGTPNYKPGGDGGASLIPPGTYFPKAHSGWHVGMESPSGYASLSSDDLSKIQRYHNGGMVGLKPDERLAVLQTGELVLDRKDTSNYMKASPAQSTQYIQPVINVQPLIVDRTEKGVSVQQKSASDGQGGLRLETIISEIDKGIGSMIHNNTSYVGRAIDATRGTSSAAIAQRG